MYVIIIVMINWLRGSLQRLIVQSLLTSGRWRQENVSVVPFFALSGQKSRREVYACGIIIILRG